MMRSSDRRIAFAVPGAFGIDDRNRAALADAQAVGLGAQDAALLRQPELLQPPLQKVPGRQPAFLVAALRRGLIAAEKDVPPRDRDADRIGDLSLGVSQTSGTGNLQFTIVNWNFRAFLVRKRRPEMHARRAAHAVRDGEVQAEERRRQPDAAAESPARSAGRASCAP